MSNGITGPEAARPSTQLETTAEVLGNSINTVIELKTVLRKIEDTLWPGEGGPEDTLGTTERPSGILELNLILARDAQAGIRDCLELAVGLSNRLIGQ